MEEYQMEQRFIDAVTRDIRINPFSAINKVVSAHLYREILDGSILPEHRLIESKLAQSLQLSRSPIKQALQDLEERGVLVRGKGNALHVRQVSYEECFKVFEARIMLESRAAYIAATRIHDSELAELEKMIEKFIEIDKTMDQASYSQTDKDFHEKIVDCARNRYISDMYKCLEFPLACYRHQMDQLIYEELHQKTGLSPGSGYHSHIFDMLKLHAPLLAQDAMVNDIQRMYGTLSRLTW